MDPCRRSGNSGRSGRTPPPPRHSRSQRASTHRRTRRTRRLSWPSSSRRAASGLPLPPDSVPNLFDPRDPAGSSDEDPVCAAARRSGQVQAHQRQPGPYRRRPGAGPHRQQAAELQPGRGHGRPDGRRRVRPRPARGDAQRAGRLGRPPGPDLRGRAAAPGHPGTARHGQRRRRGVAR
jgi:hypothetical protein